VLTINLAGGGTASGVVTDSTELKCETEDEQEDANDDRGDDSRVVASRDGSDDGDRSGSDDGDRSGSSDGDNSGPGSTSSGPGDGDRHEGDDDAEDNSCTTADLTPGTPVHEAELNTAADPDTWTEVELLK
jgi:hypothetical protein